MLGRGRHTQNCIQFDSKPSLLKSLRRLHGQGPSLAFVKPLTFQIQRHREAMWKHWGSEAGEKKEASLRVKMYQAAALVETCDMLVINIKILM